MSEWTREKLLNQIQTDWNALQTYLASLTTEQFTQPTDAAGWTVKDHVIHLAVWEKATIALLEGKSKREALDITPEVWQQDDDPINAVLQQRYRGMPLDEVLQTLEKHHDQMLQKFDTMTEADLQLPHRHYQSHSTDERPLIEWLTWETFRHYQDHLRWIQVIVNQ